MPNNRPSSPLPRFSSDHEDAMASNDEFEPYLLYRVGASAIECALWTLPDGAGALAMFLTETAANQHCAVATGGEQWRAARPPRAELIQVLKLVYRSGLRYAVLNPTAESGSHIFELHRVLQELGELPA
jgi:hypothetical protein